MSQHKRESAKDRLLREQKEEIERLKKEVAAIKTVKEPDYDIGHNQDVRVRILGVRPEVKGGICAKYDTLDAILTHFMEKQAGTLESLNRKFFMAYNPKTARQGYLNLFESQRVIQIYYDEKAKCQMWKYIYKEYPSGASL